MWSKYYSFLLEYINKKVDLNKYDQQMEGFNKVPNDEKEIVYPLVKDIMEHAMDLPTKLEVDGGFGHTWYDCK